MIYGQNNKAVILISPTSTTNGATTSATADTLGFDYAIIDVCATTSDATNNNFATLKLYDGTATNSFTAIAVLTGDDTTDGFTIPNADTSNPQVVARLSVDLRKYERYLKLECSPTTTQTIWAHMHLGYETETPTSTTNLGIGVLAVG